MSQRSFSRRFFVDSQISTDRVEIEGASAHHMINVIRVSDGDEVTLFDGSGCEFLATIENVKKNRLSARIIRTEKVSREIQNRITIAAALPKSDRQKMLVEKLVEVGVWRLIPLNAKRSVAKADGKTTEKFLRQVIEASKQCGRNQLMEVTVPMTTRELFESNDLSTAQLIAHPHRDAVSVPHIAREFKKGDSVTIAIGPEGGFDKAEVATAVASGWCAIRMGPTVLRIETAALVVATLFGIGLE